jgi:CheY-like chemotaxis protein
LIDDDQDVRTVMIKMLQKEGYEVQTASGSVEALAKLAGERPAVILLDVLLSGSDGRELCREIKAGKETKNIAIIMVSGHPGAAQKFETYGADDFIAKPIHTETLLNKIRQQTGIKKKSPPTSAGL